MSRHLIRLFFAFVCLATIVFAAACSTPKWPFGGLLAAGNTDDPPLSWAEEDMIVGVGPELAYIIFSDLGIHLSVPKRGNWSTVQTEAEDGDIDLIVAMFKNDYRASKLVFTDAYISVPVVLYVRKDKVFTFNTWKDLIGKKGAMNTGDSFGQDFDHFLSEHLTVTQAPLKKCFRRLYDGEFDYVIVNKYGGGLFAEAVNADDSLTVLQVPVTVMEYRMAFSKKSKYLDLLPEVNRKLRQLVEDGSVDKMCSKYILKYRLNSISRKDIDGGDDL